MVGQISPSCKCPVERSFYAYHEACVNDEPRSVRYEKWLEYVKVRDSKEHTCERCKSPTAAK